MSHKITLTSERDAQPAHSEHCVSRFAPWRLQPYTPNLWYELANTYFRQCSDAQPRLVEEPSINTGSLFECYGEPAGKNDTAAASVRASYRPFPLRLQKFDGANRAKATAERAQSRGAREGGGRTSGEMQLGQSAGRLSSTFHSFISPILIAKFNDHYERRQLRTIL